MKRFQSIGQHARVHRDALSKYNEPISKSCHCLRGTPLNSLKEFCRCFPITFSSPLEDFKHAAVSPVCLRAKGWGPLLASYPSNHGMLSHSLSQASQILSPSPLKSNLKPCQWAPRAPEQTFSSPFEKRESHLRHAILVPCRPSHYWKTQNCGSDTRHRAMY